MAVSLKAKKCGKMLKSPSKNNVNKQNLLLKQELKLVRILAGNNKTSRDRALKSLRKWLQERDKTMPFSEMDFERIWRGLYYAIWMADKPLVQEECVENISSLIHYTMPESSLLFFKTGLQVLGSLWIGIDQLRLDKFLMLVRRLLRQSLIFLRNHNWSYNYIRQFTEVLSESVLSTKVEPPVGLFMHFTEIYLEEIAKVINEKLTPDKFTQFVKPFIQKLAYSTDGRIIGHIRKFVFTFLIRQTDLGLEYQEKYNAWKEAGFPGSIHSMKKINLSNNEEKFEDDDEEDLQTMDTPLDPRAGRVDVELKQIKFAPKAIASALQECKFHKNTNAKSRKLLDTLTEHFNKLSNGIYPLGVTKVVDSNKNDGDFSIKKAVNRLVKFDKQLMDKSLKRKLPSTGKEDIKRRKTDSNKLNELNGDTRKQKKSSEKTVSQKEKCSNTSQRNKMNLKFNSELNNFLTRPNFDPSSVEYIFERNSGTWIVFNETSNVGNGEIQHNQVKHLDSFIESELNDSVNTKTDDEPNDKLVSSNGCIKELENCKKDNDSKQIFPKSEWDRPLAKDEIEIFIPAKKYSKKHNITELKKTEKCELKINNRLSLDSKLLQNNFTPKKVKFNTSLNKSQEVHEHHAQILSSPGIPFDANKKPTKTLLKVATSSTPLNPFYNRKLNFW